MKRSIRCSVLAALVLAAGCEEDVAVTEQFQCESMEGTAGLAFCDDFNDGSASGWRPEGGSWSVADGRYIGSGPMTLDGSECGVTRMTASLREGSGSTDVRVHAELTSLARVDKVIVLRAANASNRIELNFRGDFNDMVVQEIVDCEARYLTPEGSVAVPHSFDDRIAVDVELRGNHLLVRVDDKTVLDRDFAFANTAEGRVGVAVIDNGMTSFDSVWMQRL